MKRFQLFILLLAMVMAAGCKKYLLISYGIKQPKIENHSSLKKTLEKYHLPSDEVIAAKDSMIFYKLASKGIGVTDAAFFNSEGWYIPYAEDTVDCTGQIAPFVSSLFNGEHSRADSSFPMPFFYEELVDASNYKALNPREYKGEYDFYVMFFWTVYAGRLSRESLLEWSGAIRDAQDSGLNIRAWYVNLDCQESWGYSKEDLKKFRY